MISSYPLLNSKANMAGKCNRSILITLPLLQCFPLLYAADYDFFYFVQQWPGSSCDTTESCCYPQTGKPPSNFSIYRLWPYNSDGSYPAKCGYDKPFNQSLITDLISEMQQVWPYLSCPSNDGIRFWHHEWDFYGSCSLDQHSYFSAALELKRKYNVLQVLQDAGILSNGSFYDVKSVTSAIKHGLGHTPYIECNDNPEKKKQLYQVYLCVDKSGTKLIHCPVSPSLGECPSTIKFPKF